MQSLVSKVKSILRDVKLRGDEAIRDFYEEFYGIPRDTPIRVDESEIEEALNRVDNELVETLERVAGRIERFSRSSMPRRIWLEEIEKGVLAGQLWVPLDSVGAYIPGGRAPYVSTALMTLVPARTAGVRRRVACTPPGKNGEVAPQLLAALSIAGATEVYRIGGAHAIAAMAYGTQSVRRVDKIVGPGGAWATVAKMLVQGEVGIDMLAGPTENIIVADDSCDARIVAVDVVSQAEHDRLASSVLVSLSEEFAWRVAEELDRMREKKELDETIVETLQSMGGILIADSVEEAMWFVNEYAPEHLQLMLEPCRLARALALLRNAGSVFIGVLAPTALGDYAIGTNHVLPTGGAARWRGGLSVLDYGKLVDIQVVFEEGYKLLYTDALKLARSERFRLHELSLVERVRR